MLGAVGAVLEHDFAACSVSGELSGYSRAASGHAYFNLKDPAGGASIRCAMFRRAASLLAFTPRDGQAVEVRGRLGMYEPRGELQFIVEGMLQAGAGALYERFLRLRDKLQVEGLFDAASKRALPRYPRSVGVVTSLGAAALHDVATTLGRRSPHVEMVVYPSIVQGVDAPAALCLAISAAARRAEVDVLLVCRGGGSLEDLWAFNDERVVRAIRAAPMPVVSGVGHETDVTLADLAADVRAATPTAAAELVAPARQVEALALDRAQATIERRLTASLDSQAQRLDRLTLLLARPADDLRRRAHVLAAAGERLARSPARAVELGAALNDAAYRRLRHAAERAVLQARAQLDGVSARLLGLDPGRVLSRGYTLLIDANGHAVTSVAQMRLGERVDARMGDGQAELTVAGLHPRP